MEKLDCFGYSVFPHKYRKSTKYRSCAGVLGSCFYFIFFAAIIIYTIFIPDKPENYNWTTQQLHPNGRDTPDTYRDVNVNFNGDRVQLYLGINSVIQESVACNDFSDLTPGNCPNLNNYLDKEYYLEQSTQAADIPALEYEGIELDVKVLDWGGDGTKGYQTLQDNINSKFYHENTETQTVNTVDGADGREYVPLDSTSNFIFNQSGQQQIFPFTKVSGIQGNTDSKTTLFPMFNSNFKYQMNNEVLKKGEHPGNDEILVVSVMIKKAWYQQQNFGLGFILKLLYHNSEYDKLSGDGMDLGNFKKVLQDIDEQEEIWVRVGDFYDINKQYSKKQAPLKSEYMRIFSYDVESIYVDKNKCDFVQCYLREPEIEEIRQIKNLKPLNKEYLLIEDGFESPYYNTGQQQFDYQPSDIEERVTVAQFWLIPSNKSKLEKQNTYVIRQKIEYNFVQPIVLIISGYLLFHLIFSQINKCLLKSELTKNKTVVKDYSRLTNLTKQIEEPKPEPAAIMVPEDIKSENQEDEPLQEQVQEEDKQSEQEQLKAGSEQATTDKQIVEVTNLDLDSIRPTSKDITNFRPRIGVPWERQRLSVNGQDIPLVMPGFESSQYQETIQKQSKKDLGSSKQTRTALGYSKQSKTNMGSSKKSNYDLESNL